MHATYNTKPTKPENK